MGKFRWIIVLKNIDIYFRSSVLHILCASSTTTSKLKYTSNFREGIIIFEFWLCESFGWYWNKLVTLREIHEWILRSIEPHFGEMDSNDNEGGRLWNPIGYVLWPTMQKYLSWCWMRTTSQESHLLVESQTKKEYSIKLEPTYIFWVIGSSVASWFFGSDNISTSLSLLLSKSLPFDCYHYVQITAN